MGREMRYSAPRGTPAETVAQFLARRFTYFTHEQWCGQVRKQLVSVNGDVVTDPATALRQQDRICYDPPRGLEPDVDARLRILHEDDHLVVVSKSGNIPVSEGGRYCRNVLTHVVAEAIERDTGRKVEPLLPVHRLDKETSGLVVLAKTRPAAAVLGAQFAAHGAAATAAAASVAAGPSWVSPVDPKVSATRRTTDAGEQITEGGDDVVEPAEKEYEVLLEGTLTDPVGGGEGSDAAADDVEDDVATVKLNGWIGPAEAGAVPPSVGARDSAAQPCNASGPARAKPSADDPLARLRMACYGEPRSSSGDGTGVAATMPKGAKPASSVFRVARTGVLRTAGGESSSAAGKLLTHARVTLLTGRTHQIRLHAAWAGAPVVGDKLYVVGAQSVPVASYLARVRGEETVELAEDNTVPRHLLHCAKLTVTHPETKQRMTFEDSGFQQFAVECPWLANVRWASGTGVADRVPPPQLRFEPLWCIRPGDAPLTCDEVAINISAAHNRAPAPDDPSSAGIVTAWREKQARLPHVVLFNGTKFRLHGVGDAAPRHVRLDLGVTDYRSTASTNFAADPRSPPCDADSGKPVLLPHMAHALGVEALVITADDQVVLFRRSMRVAENPGMYCCPGGHAEPATALRRQTAGAGDEAAEVTAFAAKYPQSYAKGQGAKIMDGDFGDEAAPEAAGQGAMQLAADFARLLSPESVAAELFQSPADEVVEELGVEASTVRCEGLCAVFVQAHIGWKPVAEFRVRLSLTAAEVDEIHSRGEAREQFESEGRLVFVPVAQLKSEGIPPNLPLCPTSRACLEQFLP